MQTRNLKALQKGVLPTLKYPVIRKVTPQAFYNISLDILVLDLRPKNECEVNQLPGVINLPPNIELEKQRDQLFLGYLSSCVMLYNKNGDENDEHYKQVLSFLEKYPSLKDIQVLEGGFERLYAEFPFFCTGDKRYLRGKIYPSQILPFLYLGDFVVSAHLDILKNINVRKILNITAREPNHFASEKDYKIDYLRLPVEDSSESPIDSYFENAFQFIDSAKKENVSILVHCAAGISRSATIAVAYIMKSMDMSVDDALSFVKERRVIARPNDHFMRCLYLFEEKLVSDSKNEK